MNKQLVQQVNATQIRNDIPDIRTGDKIRVRVSIRENNKERQQYVLWQIYKNGAITYDEYQQFLDVMKLSA